MQILSKLFQGATRRIKVRMLDAAPRSTRDASLAEQLRQSEERASPADLGRRWEGDMQPVGAGVAMTVAALAGIKDKARLNDAIKRVVRDIEMYGNRLASSTASPGPAGSLTFSERAPEFRLEPDLSARDPEFDVAPYVGAGATPNDIAEANADYWNPRKTTDSARRVRPTIASCVTPAGMQDALNKHWASANGAPRTISMTDAARLGQVMQRAPSVSIALDAWQRMINKFYGAA